jgi:hypothetical protein
MGVSGPVSAGPAPSAAKQAAPSTVARSRPVVAAEAPRNVAAGPRWCFGDLAIRPKLTVGAVDDPAEHEADVAADRVMRMADPGIAGGGVAPPVLRRKCSACEEEGPVVQRAPLDPPRIGLTSEAPTAVHAALALPGRAMDAEVRRFFEPRFNEDFSNVRLHMGAEAAHSARTLGAKAYTVGSDIVFADAQYDASSASGRRLLAHELAHVVQASDASHMPSAIRRQSASQDPTAASGATGSAPPAASGATAGPASAPVTWKSGPDLPPPLELPYDEAARRVNLALDAIGSGLTFVNRPPAPSAPAVASAAEPAGQNNTDQVVRTAPDDANPLKSASPLAKIHGGVVASLQFCYDCLTGEASLNGWVWAGVGYDLPVVGWVGGYYFAEKMWFKNNIGNWFTPGQCRTDCDSAEKDKTSEHGWGIAGFPVDVRPGQRARFSKASLEVGALLTPHSLCDADLEIIALLNVLGYLGPVATLATKAVDGANALTGGTPHFTLEAGIDASVTFHLCRGQDHFLTVNEANFCAGGFVGAGVGLSHDKAGNHGAV